MRPESQQHLDELQAQMEHRERSRKRKVLWITAVPVVLALLFLGYTAWQVDKQQERLEYANTELEHAHMELEETTEAVEMLHAEIQDKQHLLESIRDSIAELRAFSEQIIEDIEANRMGDARRTIEIFQNRIIRSEHVIERGLQPGVLNNISPQDTEVPDRPR